MNISHEMGKQQQYTIFTGVSELFGNGRWLLGGGAMNDRAVPRTTSPTHSTVRQSWWPGWIWAMPLAALLLVGWWGLRRFAPRNDKLIQ